MSFVVSKKNALSKVDKSRKGSIDRQIAPLVKLINSNKDYFTTSSCAGRTVLINLIGSRKDQTKWLFKSHSEVTAWDIFSAIPKKAQGSVWLKYEPFIIHVHCAGIDAAKQILDVARSAGMKKSGIIAVSSDFVAEIEGTDRVETLVFLRKNLVELKYIQDLTKEINRKIRSNKKKVRKFLELFISL